MGLDDRKVLLREPLPPPVVHLVGPKLHPPLEAMARPSLRVEWLDKAHRRAVRAGQVVVVDRVGRGTDEGLSPLSE